MMNRKLTMLATLLMVFSIPISGCNLGSDSFFKKNTIVKNLYDELYKPGPTRQLIQWDEKIMYPALVMAKELKSKNYVLATSEYAQNIKKLQQWQVELSHEKPILMTDAYLYFGKSFLQALQLKLENKLDVQTLEDSKLAFENYRSKALQGKELYTFAELKPNMLSKGMSYGKLRSLLKMPGFALHGHFREEKEGLVQVQNAYLWVYNGNFLYVEFLNDKAVKWKMSQHLSLAQNKSKIIDYDAVARTVTRLNNKTTINNMNRLLKSEGEILDKFPVTSREDNKKSKWLKKYIWTFGYGYIYAEFLNDRLYYWKYQGINNGFWHGNEKI